MVAWLFIVFALLFPRPVQAIVDPLSVPNNRYGMHIADTNDIPDVATLVNSTGGDWGYVTLVLSQADRDLGRWQNIFKQLRQLHLIPLVRLATRVEGSSWFKPDLRDIKESAELLNKLVWTTQNRYVILYNEPNHAKEWGNALDPEGYAAILAEGAKILKEISDDFFILPAALDVSAVSDGAAMEAASYLRRMILARPDLLNLLDGWNSHSYPNPGFSGSPIARGRGTLTSYSWEMEFLRSLGLTKNLPIFITETGWWHSEGKFPGGGLSPAQVGEYLKIAATGAWSDPRIVAVTPFIFNYQDMPFDHFSFKKLGSPDFYPHYDAYKNLAKVKGKPNRLERYTLEKPLIPERLIAGSVYTLSAVVKNEGQAILSAEEGYEIILGKDTKPGFLLLPEPILPIDPEREGVITVHLKTPVEPGTYTVSLILTHEEKQILLETNEVAVLPPPSLEIRAKLGWRKTSNAEHVTVLVYRNDQLIHKFQDLELKEGALTVEKLTSVIPNQPYRIVVLVPYYLPRQTITALGESKTMITFKRFYPLDMDRDGGLTINDLRELLKQKPHAVWQRFLGP